ATEVARRAKALHELFGDRRAGVDVLREAREHLEVEDPILEERRGRLHEVALRPGDADERDALAGEAVHEVAELVEVGHDLSMLHERGTRQRRGVGEVAAQHAVTGLLAADAEPQRRVEEPLVLSFARMHVERYPTRGLAVDGHVEAFDGRMPPLLIHDRREGHPEELAVQVEDRLPDAAVLEVRPDLLCIEVEAPGLYAVEVVP